MNFKNQCVGTGANIGVKMKKLPISVLTILSVFVCVKGSPLYGSDDKKNGCGPSKEYELKDDKSEPIKMGSTNSSSSDNSSKKIR